MQPIYNSVNSSIWRDKEEASRRRKIRQEKLVLSASVVAIIVSLAGLSATSIVFLQAFRQQGRPTSISETPIACVSYQDIVKIPSYKLQSDPVISKLRTTVEGGKHKYCAHNSEQMSALLELAMRRKEADPVPLPEFNPKEFTFSAVSAHKRLYPSITYPNLTVPLFDEDSLVVTHFKIDNDHLVEHARGVQVEEEGLRVLRSGQYFIYSNIHFVPHSAYPCKNFKFQVWGHYVEKIVKNNRGASGCIMKTAHTCCDHCTGDNETSFTSGVFYLEEGDLIKVSISGHGLIYFGKQTSFAGLMMLGGSNERR